MALLEFIFSGNGLTVKEITFHPVGKYVLSGKLVWLAIWTHLEKRTTDLF